MTRYTLMLFQEAYPEQILLDKIPEDDGIHLYCYLLNKDKEIHTLLFEGRGFKDASQIDNTINKLLKLEI